MTSSPYPEWTYYPSNRRPDAWVLGLLGVIAAARGEIDTAIVRTTLKSDDVLAALRPGLEAEGWDVEASKLRTGLIRRPVLFGPRGVPRVAYDVDAVHDEDGIVMEIEAGRGARSNAAYRDVIRGSLIVEARFFVLGLAKTYRHHSGARLVEVRSYDDFKDQMDAIYASGRLQLPFDGVLLFGY